MVSLADDSSRQGGYFFTGDTSIVTPDTDDLLGEHPALSAESDPVFRAIHTTWLIIIHIILVVCLEVAVFLVPHFCKSPSMCGIDTNDIIIYSHAILWFLTVLADRYYDNRHQISRRNGYLEFYRQTKHIRRLPLTIVSGGNAFLLITIVLVNRYCNMTYICGTLVNLHLHSINYIQFVISIETVLLIPILIQYSVKTCRFNRRRALPDVHEEELLTVYLQSHSHSADVGFRDEDYVEQILEKQADMIRYLKQHNTQLGKRILKLTTTLNAREVNT